VLLDRIALSLSELKAGQAINAARCTSYTTGLWLTREEENGPKLITRAEMQRILKRNQRKLPKVDLDVDAYRNEPAQKIREAWETSMETLRPLLKDIAATDRLIAGIVYLLYGLTEEEIAVMEGRLKHE
jgi:hypothetical protein